MDINIGNTQRDETDRLGQLPKVSVLPLLFWVLFPSVFLVCLFCFAMTSRDLLRSFWWQYTHWIHLINNTQQRLGLIKLGPTGYKAAAANYITLGDFNIHFEATRNPVCRNFRAMLSVLVLDQKIKKPTHEKEHTFDVVITRQDEDDLVTDISVNPIDGFDRSTISAIITAQYLSFYWLVDQNKF